MHRLLSAAAAAALVCACGSAPASTSLAGLWLGPAVTNFATPVTLDEQLALQVTVSGNTATIAGICGGTGTSVGAGTLDATLATLGTGTYAHWAGGLDCPARAVTQRGCDAVVFTFRYASVLAGTNTDFGVPGYPSDTSTLSFSGGGSLSGCGVGDTFATSFIGTPAGPG